MKVVYSFIRCPNSLTVYPHDILLPKLVSGEIDVSELDIEIGA